MTRACSCGRSTADLSARACTRTTCELREAPTLSPAADRRFGGCHLTDGAPVSQEGADGPSFREAA